MGIGEMQKMVVVVVVEETWGIEAVVEYALEFLGRWKCETWPLASWVVNRFVHRVFGSETNSVGSKTYDPAMSIRA